ncbi:MAG TPA: Sua5/YciO/YrdC/YwlC family protein [Gammaproteobacteria bacterium]|nr:Sua5/YciO/YrdC/YwlC family protein [Gammaproteobacteria bacterium]
MDVPQLSVAQAAAVLADGGVVAYPTESCFGLGCDPANEAAVARVLAAKGREQAKGLILIGGCWAHLAPYIGELPADARARLTTAWPGPVTFLVPPSPAVPAWIRGAHPAVALRWTAHPVAAHLCQAFGGAVVSTSANRQGQPALRSAQGVTEAFGPSIDGVVHGAVGDRQAPSAIVDAISGDQFR